MTDAISMLAPGPAPQMPPRAPATDAAGFARHLAPSRQAPSREAASGETPGEAAMTGADPEPAAEGETGPEIAADPLLAPRAEGPAAPLPSTPQIEALRGAMTEATAPGTAPTEAREAATAPGGTPAAPSDIRLDPTALAAEIPSDAPQQPSGPETEGSRHDALPAGSLPAEAQAATPSGLLTLATGQDLAPDAGPEAPPSPRVSAAESRMAAPVSAAPPKTQPASSTAGADARMTAPLSAAPQGEALPDTQVLPQMAASEARVTPAQTGAAAAPDSALQPAPEARPTPPLLRNVLDRLSEIEISEGKTRLLLRPQGLGVLEIDLARLLDGRLQLAIRAENPLLLEALKQEGGALAAFMSERGFDLSGGQPDLERYAPPMPEAEETESDTAAEPEISVAAQPLLRADRLDLVT